MDQDEWLSTEARFTTTLGTLDYTEGGTVKVGMID